jgi:hypothetical protein
VFRRIYGKAVIDDEIVCVLSSSVDIQQKQHKTKTTGHVKVLCIMTGHPIDNK